MGYRFTWPIVVVRAAARTYGDLPIAPSRATGHGLDVSGSAPRTIRAKHVCLHVNSGRSAWWSARRRADASRPWAPDTFEPLAAEALARAPPHLLTPLYPATATVSSRRWPRAEAPRLLSIVTAEPGTASLATQAPRNRLRIPIGVDPRAGRSRLT